MNDPQEEAVLVTWISTFSWVGPRMRSSSRRGSRPSARVTVYWTRLSSSGEGWAVLGEMLVFPATM